MDNLEITAKTVEEATKKALNQLNVSIDEVEITVLSEGKGGILGIGAENARISAKLIEHKNGNILDDQEIQISKEILGDLIDILGFQSNIDIGSSTHFVEEDSANTPVRLNISGGDDLGILIGRRGSTLDALQYITRLIVSRKIKNKTPIIVDVEDYKEKHYADLRTLALNVAQQVTDSESSCKLEPMSAYERRIIHMTLANNPDVMTESIGEGDNRKVVVIPKNRK